jgi:hypothetical protein
LIDLPLPSLHLDFWLLLLLALLESLAGIARSGEWTMLCRGQMVAVWSRGKDWRWSVVSKGESGGEKRRKTHKDRGGRRGSVVKGAVWSVGMVVVVLLVVRGGGGRGRRESPRGRFQTPFDNEEMREFSVRRDRLENVPI